MRLRLHLKKDEYRKYSNFGKYDEELDKKTTLYMDRSIATMINDLHRFTDKIELYDKSGEILDSLSGYSGYYFFKKALVGHLAFIWYDLMPHWSMSIQDMQRTVRSQLLEDRAQDMRRGKIRYPWTMPRYVTGLFEYPVPGLGIFSLSMCIEYAYCVFALNNGIVFYRDDQEYLEETRDRLKQIIDFSLDRVNKHIIPRL